jgi:hypothetical protein
VQHRLRTGAEPGLGVADSVDAAGRRRTRHLSAAARSAERILTIGRGKADSHMPQTCTACGKEMGGSASCPYCAQSAEDGGRREPLSVAKAVRASRSWPWRRIWFGAGLIHLILLLGVMSFGAVFGCPPIGLHPVGGSSPSEYGGSGATNAAIFLGLVYAFTGGIVPLVLSVVGALIAVSLGASRRKRAAAIGNEKS